MSMELEQLVDEIIIPPEGGLQNKENREAYLDNLAALDPMEYETERTVAAKKLGMRVSKLDKTVEKRRNAYQPGFHDEYQITDRGVFRVLGERREFIMSRVDVVARTRDTSGKNHGLLLKILDPDGVEHIITIPKTMLAGDGSELRKLLMSYGVDIPAKKFARDSVLDYLMAISPEKVVLCVERTGWSRAGEDLMFVFPNISIGTNDAEAQYQSDEEPPEGYEVSGLLSEWQDQVSRYCRGNHYLALTVSMAFAAPLLRLLGLQSGGINLYGPSSIGKTIAMYVGNSATGAPSLITRMRATDNGMEAVAEMRNDTLLCTDELGQLEPRIAGLVAYMLGNGQGKSRATRSGGARRTRKWTALFVVTAECSLESYMGVAGQRSRAGQEVRLIDLPVDNNDGRGIVEELHGFEDSRALVDTLFANSQKYYGIALREFLVQLTNSGIDNHLDIVRKLVDQFIRDNQPQGASGQVLRVAERFGLIAAAGELATSMGITGWESGEATMSVSSLFARWLTERGGGHPAEITKILAHVRALLEEYGDSRFEDLEHVGTYDQRIPSRWGYRDCVKGDYYHYILPEIFKQEFCKGYSQKQVCQVLQDTGLLEKDAGNKNSKSIRIKGSNTRVYKLKNVLIDQEEPRQVVESVKDEQLTLFSLDPWLKSGPWPKCEDEQVEFTV